MIHVSSGFYITKIPLNSLSRLMVNHVWVSIHKLQTCILTNPDEKEWFPNLEANLCALCFRGSN